MNIKSRMDGVADMLGDLDNYRDVDGFVTDLEYLVGQLSYFYNNLTPKQTGDPSTTFYKPKKLPKTHQIAYFNLTRGFPKELYGGHWCYVLKQFKSKFVIIPTTSVKEDSLKADPNFQIDIKVEGFMNGRTTRMQISDMRTVDAQRLYFNKGFYDVLTDKEYIAEEMNKILSL
ncbi:MAG: hypothetical protein GX366_02525 [Epulopiscium sp.]|nr:hypothetical protein [Candidatus Epulonipiscium sp.]